MSCGQWGKHTNFELGTRVPLIFHAAGQTTGLKSNTLVESLDICEPGNHHVLTWPSQPEF